MDWKELISFRLFMMESIYSLGRNFKEEQLSFMLEFKERTFILRTGVSKGKELIFFRLEFQGGTYPLGTYILSIGISRRNIYPLGWNFKKEHISFMLEFQERRHIYSLDLNFKKEHISFRLGFQEGTYIL